MKKYLFFIVFLAGFFPSVYATPNWVLIGIYSASSEDGANAPRHPITAGDYKINISGGTCGLAYGISGQTNLAWRFGGSQISGDVYLTFTLGVASNGWSTVWNGTGLAFWGGATSVKVYKDITEFTLTVVNGTGSGSFALGANCPIAPNVPSGSSFIKWTPSGCNLNSSDTTSSNSITMPSNNCTVTASVGNSNTLTVVNGTGSGTYGSGAVVPIMPIVPSGKTFISWSGEGCSLLSSPATNASNYITMAGNNVSITANFSNNGEGHHLTVVNGSGSGDYSANTIVPIAYTGGKTFISWDLISRLTSSGNTSNTSLNMPEFDYTIVAIDEGGGGGGTGNGHTIVDNFGDLTGIITTPIVNSIDIFRSQVHSAISDFMEACANNFSSVIDKMSAMQENDNNNTLNIVNGMASVGESINNTLGTIKDDTSGIKTDTAGIRQDTASIKVDVSGIRQDTASMKLNVSNIKTDTGQINEKLSDIIDLLSKSTSALTPGGGSVPDSSLDDSDYATPENAFSISKLNSVKTLMNSKIGVYLSPSLGSPNNSILILPFSHIPYGGLSDYPVQFFNNPILMPFIALVREILLCGVYVSTIYMIIKIVRTWEV